MPPPQTVKLLPRNAAALRQGRDSGETPSVTAGNPISTRLEAGIGNCFPGLECDLRNLERRFFPCLEVDISDNSITIVNVDLASLDAAVKAGQLDKSAAPLFRRIATDLRDNQSWSISEITGEFTLYGKQTLKIRSLSAPTDGDNRLPPDAWTAVRVLIEQSTVTLRLVKAGTRTAAGVTGKRSRYLDHQGALSAAFQPGELTQSLCSPWTHDFRDCGCFYWASNHPDIAKPPMPPDAAASPEWDRPVPWERADRSVARVPERATATDSTSVELDYYEINHRWQELNFVLGGREVIEPYSPGQLTATPFATIPELIAQLRFAAGVELAAMQEYLAAAFSLRDPATLEGQLRDDVEAAKVEIMRVAVSEMHHLRVVNDVLRLLTQTGRFEPAMQIATQIPGKSPNQTLPLEFRPADKIAIQRFIDIESPSISVDGLYSKILATLVNLGTETEQHAIRTVMAEGEDHYETFLFVQEWLAAHDEPLYLRPLKAVASKAGVALHEQLQLKYRELLNELHDGYARGLPQGAGDINAARDTMLSRTSGILGLAQSIAEDGSLVTFDLITDDPRFGVIKPP
jgi:hypothetical protein